MSYNDDDVVREIDVYITEDLDLYLTQFPLKPVYADQVEINSAIFKPKHKKLELDVPYSSEALRSFENHPDVKHQKYVSSIVAQNICLGAGVIHNNALHITPITSVLQMRPSFKNLQSRGESVEDIIDDEHEGPEIASADSGLQHVQLKRKESERAQSARTQSYTYIQAQEDQEPWYSLKVHEIGSGPSDAKFGEMYHVAAEQMQSEEEEE